MDIHKFRYRINKLFYFLCALVLLVGCKEDEDYLTLSVSELNLPAKGGELYVDVSTNSAWSVGLTSAESSSWVNLSTLSGDEGTTSVHITFTKNETDKDRVAEVIFRAGKAIQTLKITQKEKSILVATDREWYIGQRGGKWPFPISRNIEYTINISSEAQSWLHLPETRTVATDTLYLSVDENIGAEMRKGAIYIKAADASIVDTLFVQQQELSLKLSSEQLDFASETDSRTILITSTHTDNKHNPDYSLDIDPEAALWCQVEKSEDAHLLLVSVSENKTKLRREANLRIKSSVLTKTLRIVQQEDGQVYHGDGEYMQLQTASIGKGVNVAIMGDGFIKADLLKNGRYENLGNQAMEHFFSVEPYKSNRAYFNIYLIFAKSEEAGVNGEIPGLAVNNRFGSIYGEGTSINWSDNICDIYLDKVPELRGVIEMTTILFLNSTKYAGTAHIRSNGFCIAACPVSDEVPPYDFEGLVHHEAGGHGFGLLADEYFTVGERISKAETDLLALWHQYDCYRNISSTDNLSEVPWSNFIGKEKYAYVGAYEGGYLYQFGIWRPEVNSCMNDNIPYYNAPSRWAIVDRIRRLAGVPSSFEEFMQSDNVFPMPVSKTKRSKPYPPLGEPVLIKSKTSGRL